MHRQSRSDSNPAPLSDLPLVILTRGVADEPGGGSMAPDSEHRKDHAAQAALSRRGQLIVAARSGHHIQIDEPAVVVQAVRNALMAAPKASP